jgi:ribosomal protein S3|tara:strand:+ start:5938 stop:6198 length:261 start_codon:yes stop_codon:yes gene_type:complete
MEKHNKHNKYKSLFLTYFDGCYGFEPEPNLPSTYQLGVCKIEYTEETNVLTVHLRRPGLLIGRAGSLIDKVKKHLECEIDVIEVTL